MRKRTRPKQKHEESFDRSALILAWLERGGYNKNSKPTYYDAVYEAYAKAFGIDLNEFPLRPDVPYDMDGLEGLFRSVVRAYFQAQSPFSGGMCAPREFADMYQRYHSSLDTAITRLRNLHLMMLIELVERIWGGEGKPHQVSKAELDACGFPQEPAPDPADFW